MLHTAIFLTELLKFGLFFKGIMEMKFHRYYVALISLGLFMVSLVIEPVLILWQIRNTICVVVILFFMLEEKWNRRGMIITLAVLLFHNIENIGIYILRDMVQLFSLEGNARINYEKYYLVTNLLIIVIISAMLLIRSICRKIKGVKKEKRAIVIADHMWTILVVLLIIISFGTDATVTYRLFDDMDGIIHLLNISMYGGEAFVLALACYIFYANTKTRDSYETEKMLKETQQVYYEALLAKEEETRSFRHDLANHMVCLEGLLEKEQLADAREYMQEMQTNLQGRSIRESNEKVNAGGVYITGNEILDTMLNYYVGKLEMPTRVHVYGQIERGIAASYGVLCSVFSNIIKNAVEELNEGKFECPQLTVKITNGNQYVKIETENTSREKVIKNGLVKTSKKDKRNHGFGLKNIRSNVEMLKGQYEAEYINGKFHVTVYLPLEECSLTTVDGEK